MSKSNYLENAILNLLFNGTTIANVAQNASSSPATAFFISLHTASPSETGTQSSNEATYADYARVSVNRNSGGWTITNNSVSPTASISFPEASGGTNTITHIGIGLNATGSGTLLFHGALNSSITVNAGVTPRITTSSTITED